MPGIVVCYVASIAIPEWRKFLYSAAITGGTLLAMMQLLPVIQAVVGMTALLATHLIFSSRGPNADLLDMPAAFSTEVITGGLLLGLALFAGMLSLIHI